jgi:uncharacterized membrane protein YeaQ/YmgE (transglycosylase-associated protein family)
MEILAWIIIGSLVGGFIGSIKNRTSQGVWLGLLLGPIGCIIVAVLPAVAAAQCPHCHGGVDGVAAVCCHCGRDIPQIFPPDRWNRSDVSAPRTSEASKYSKPDPGWLELAVTKQKATQPAPVSAQTQKFLRCPCGTCDVNIEFPPDGIGQTINCPKCGLPTLLFDSDYRVNEPAP